MLRLLLKLWVDISYSINPDACWHYLSKKGLTFVEAMLILVQHQNIFTHPTTQPCSFCRFCSLHSCFLFHSTDFTMSMFEQDIFFVLFFPLGFFFLPSLFCVSKRLCVVLFLSGWCCFDYTSVLSILKHIIYFNTIEKIYFNEQNF